MNGCSAGFLLTHSSQLPRVSESTVRTTIRVSRFGRDSPFIHEVYRYSFDSQFSFCQGSSRFLILTNITKNAVSWVSSFTFVYFFALGFHDYFLYLIRVRAWVRDMYYTLRHGAFYGSFVFAAQAATLSHRSSASCWSALPRSQSLFQVMRLSWGFLGWSLECKPYLSHAPLVICIAARGSIYQRWGCILGHM